MGLRRDILSFDRTLNSEDLRPGVPELLFDPGCVVRTAEISQPSRLTKIEGWKPLFSKRGVERSSRCVQWCKQCVVRDVAQTSLVDL